MKKLLPILFLVISSLCAGNVCGTPYEIAPRKYHEETFPDLPEGSIISWDWHVVT
jgi:hypothetical protein